MSDESRKVLVRIRDVYGVRKYYPANEEAELFLRLGNTKTISSRWFPVIRELGFELQVVKEEL